MHNIRYANLFQGNVYSGGESYSNHSVVRHILTTSKVGDGVNVWSPEGILLGKFAVANGGVNKQVFLPRVSYNR
jgi:hypothetical protein